MTILIDILLVGIIALSAYIGYRKGIVKMLLSFLVILLALSISWGLSAPLASGGYQLFFQESVSNSVDTALMNIAPEQVEQAVEEFLNSDSVLSGVGSWVGFDTKVAMEQLQGESLEKVGTILKEDVIQPPVTLLLRCIVFLLLFILLWIVLSLVAKAINKTAKLPVIKGINAWLGAFVGLVIGILLCFALSVLLSFVIEINPQGFWGITHITKENSLVYGFLSDLVENIVK